MADYYDALIAEWANHSGTTQQKIDQINAKTIAVAGKAIVPPSDIINCITATDLAALTTAQVNSMSMILSGAEVDASIGTTIRAALQAIFAGKATTLANLGALAAKYDTVQVSWLVANGYKEQISTNDTTAAGLV